MLSFFSVNYEPGAAKNNRIVAFALYPIVKQSFHLYYEIADIVSILLDRFEDLDELESTKVHEIISHIAKQYEELDTFYYWCIDACIARTSDYPEIDKISQDKLEVMDNLIREKTKIEQQEPVHEPEPEPTPEPEPEPEATPELISIEPEPTTEGVVVEEKKETKTQDIGDLLCFDDDTPTTQQHSDQLALALFGNEKTTTQPWEAFNDSGDWETALVQNASQLSKQQPSLPGGFDTLLLDSMYQQGAILANMSTRSASSLALPPPPTAANGTFTSGGDPFAASLAVAPPSDVQMSDIEKKQRLLMEEQMMWQQYQGQVGMANMYMNQYPYNMGGGYTYQY